MKTNRLMGAVGTVAAVALFGAVLIGVPALIDTNKAPEVSEVIGVKPSQRAPHFVVSTEHLYVPPAPEVEVPVEEVYVEPEPAPYSNSGEAVPFIPSADPNNANGGDYIDPGVYCLNGSASGNPPICD